MTEERMYRLEEQVAFQEDTIQKLDKALAHQQQQLIAAERKIEILMQQLHWESLNINYDLIS